MQTQPIEPTHTEIIPLKGGWEACPAPPGQPPGEYFRRSVRLRPLEGQRAWVRLEPSGSPAVFFLNGKRMYASRERQLPVEFDITDHTEQLDNQLCARFEQPGPAGSAPNPAASLLYAPPVSIPDAAVRAFTRRGLLETVVTLENRTLAPLEASLDLAVYAEEGLALRFERLPVRLAAGVLTPLRAAAAFPGAAFWSPQNPRLYRLEARLEQDGRLLDERQLRFGWREIWRERGAWLLNGRPLRIERTASLELADSTALGGLPRDADLVCLDGAPPDPRLLDWADERGLLLAAAYTAEPDPRHALDHLLALVRRDRAHPSLAAWLVEDLPGARPLLAQLDPTRPVFARGQPPFQSA